MTQKEKLEAIRTKLATVAQKSQRSYTIDQEAAFEILTEVLDALIEGDDAEQAES